MRKKPKVCRLENLGSFSYKTIYEKMVIQRKGAFMLPGGGAWGAKNGEKG